MKGENMKNLFIIGIFVAFLLITVPAMAERDFTLYAGRTYIPVGTVSVSDDTNNLYVEYNLNDGWLMNDSHVGVAQYYWLIPQTKTGNPIPGRFTNSTNYPNPVKNSIISIPLPPDTMFTIATQADVIHETNGVIDASEGAWAAHPSCYPFNFLGAPRFNNKNWAIWFTYPYVGICGG
jgi:hypothetical protein